MNAAWLLFEGPGQKLGRNVTNSCATEIILPKKSEKVSLRMSTNYGLERRKSITREKMSSPRVRTDEKCENK